MSFYPPKIAKRVAEAGRSGVAGDPGAAATEASFVCGSFVSISLCIDNNAARIVDARYRTNGCGFLVAASEIITEYLLSARLPDLHGLRAEELLRRIRSDLGSFPQARSHCSVMAVDAARAALAEYRRTLISEYAGDTALVCTCFGVDEETIEKCVLEIGAADADEVAARCRAGSGCGACRPIVQDIIDGLFR